MANAPIEERNLAAESQPAEKEAAGPAPKKKTKKKKSSGFPLWAAILLGFALIIAGLAAFALTRRESGSPPKPQQISSMPWGEGRLRRSLRFDSLGNISSERLEVFNSREQRTSLKVRSGGQTIQHQRWLYDEEGQLLQTESYSPQGSLTRCTKYEYSEDYVLSKSSYDAYGDLVCYSRHTPNGKPLYWELTEYNSEGKPSFFGRYAADRSLDYWREYEYDEQGLLRRRQRFMAKGQSMELSLYEYDEQGRLLLEKQFDANDKLNAKTEFSYNEDGSFSSWSYFYGYEGDESREYTEYDARGNRTYYAAYPYFYSIRNGSRTVYDDYGRVLEHSELGAGGSLLKTYRYEYDEQGRELRRFTTDAYNYPSYYENRYDEDGNCIERIYYDHKGNVTKRVEDPEAEVDFRKIYRPDW